MPILTRTKTQQDRFVTLSKFDLDRCYKLACAKLSEEVPFKLTKTYAQALYSPSFEDIVSINNLQAVQDIFYTKLKNNYKALNMKPQPQRLLVPLTHFPPMILIGLEVPWRMKKMGHPFISQYFLI
ncbi:15665_t:CDS:2 [Funneliformis caledonium]|uniref:15665_t:CDS:1 n=1 Tax=Funneliformis caledonium TaxID=1117310 RepID=A0A9N9A0R0_9GLOM|nr:15665_t:CDS:2 [Funneliformis caledonium]